MAQSIGRAARLNGILEVAALNGGLDRHSHRRASAIEGSEKDTTMDKRLQKRHKRQVARAKDRIRISEPDVRTPEEIKAAHDASRPAVARVSGTSPAYAGPAMGKHSRAAGSTTKADG